MTIVLILAALAYLEIVILVLFLSKKLRVSNVLACSLAFLWPASLPIAVWLLAKYVGPMVSLMSVLEQAPGGMSEEK